MSSGHMLIHQYMLYHGLENFKIELIEMYPCENSNEARSREEYWRIYYNPLYSCRKARHSIIEQEPELLLPKIVIREKKRTNFPRHTTYQKLQILETFQKFEGMF